ncbi:MULTISPECIES: alpha-D-ribose 1-methylphosphonate 5-triphosphate diphosphatase [Thalassospira]|uniref:Phosphonate metabolism protein PhnM n=2 Tax=Thalassospira tepidiphila TaxID=393657 RepID=A0A853KZ85_9PROT|nr:MULTISPECIES: alpha-D-ribose 1-methylphosphonate 5-triphosphate diphosphatase [Thalassospira]MBO6578440.1 alpha-D-ribose 1-methylphosphonate 5-triphosphate diphosphatase [Thalassospira sp.]MBO6801813.1 alpha-D-ribose 1-methylphosphonate 5-triphosphate diphosphatase [Thalassospira sp.]MBO6818666.1 alpha-D-ribose 1-methylphosphonate 5-triphosphate diphosphatase [Thalassospira sp.]MBO6887530.1 alpha-D-ribose 1-methylphosphonate 5-triphosphate diphosphatase [Thalassospira sp.]NJB76632.1 alpha-D
MTEQIFTNAKLVLANEVIDGAVQVKDGKISDISDRPSNLPGAEDMGGDYLMPGLVELHTDNLDKHLTPRPKTRWPATAAVVAHDNQVASAGITTVFDAVSIGDVNEGSERIVRLIESVNALEHALENALLRADHKLHLRCETSFPGMVEALGQLIDLPLVSMLSVMDHTPGQRQFVSLDAYYTYYQGKYGLNDEEMRKFIATRRRDAELYSEKHRRHVVEQAHAKGLALASHDDATTEHVAEAVADKMTVAEFPTTLEAAKASHEGGLGVMMGGPNLVRGGSHSGNVAAGDLAKHGYLDIISSDYVPHSLLHGAMKLFDEFDGYDLPRAIRTVSLNPATHVGLDDRGEIAVGKRGDLIRVHHSPHHPIVRGVWREGVRVS